MKLHAPRGRKSPKTPGESSASSLRSKSPSMLRLRGKSPARSRDGGGGDGSGSGKAHRRAFSFQRLKSKSKRRFGGSGGSRGSASTASRTAEEDADERAAAEGRSVADEARGERVGEERERPGDDDDDDEATTSHDDEREENDEEAATAEEAAVQEEEEEEEEKEEEETSTEEDEASVPFPDALRTGSDLSASIEGSAEGSTEGSVKSSAYGGSTKRSVSTNRSVSTKGSTKASTSHPFLRDCERSTGSAPDPTVLPTNEVADAGLAYVSLQRRLKERGVALDDENAIPPVRGKGQGWFGGDPCVLFVACCRVIPDGRLGGLCPPLKRDLGRDAGIKPRELQNRRDAKDTDDGKDAGRTTDANLPFHARRYVHCFGRARRQQGRRSNGELGLGPSPREPGPRRCSRRRRQRGRPVVDD